MLISVHVYMHIYEYVCKYLLVRSQFYIVRMFIHLCVYTTIHLEFSHSICFHHLISCIIKSLLYCSCVFLFVYSCLCTQLCHGTQLCHVQDGPVCVYSWII